MRPAHQPDNQPNFQGFGQTRSWHEPCDVPTPMKPVLVLLLALTMSSVALASPNRELTRDEPAPGRTLKSSGGLLLGVGLASAGAALLMDRTMGDGLLKPFDNRQNDVLGNMLDGGLVVAGVGLTFGITAWVIASDADDEDLRIDSSPTGNGGIVRARVAGDVWVSSQGLHF